MAKVASINATGPFGSIIGRNGSTNWLYVPVDSDGNLQLNTTGSSAAAQIASKDIGAPAGALIGYCTATSEWLYLPVDQYGNLQIHSASGGTAKIANANQQGPAGSAIGREGASEWLYVPTDTSGNLGVNTTGSSATAQVASDSAVGPAGAAIGYYAADKVWLYVPVDEHGNLCVNETGSSATARIASKNLTAPAGALAGYNSAGPNWLYALVDEFGNLQVDTGGPPPAGLPEQWLMHDGSPSTTFADATPNDNTITATDITWGTGTGVTSPTFNGTTSTGVAAQTAITNFDGTQPFSVSVWVNIVQSTNETALVSNLVPGSNFQGWELGTGPSGAEVYFFLINDYPSNALNVSSVGTIPVGTPTNVIVTYSAATKTSSDVALYVGGVSAGLNVLSDTLSALTASGIPIHIGSRSDGTIPYDGSMSNLQIFSGVLTSGEIAAIQVAGP